MSETVQRSGSYYWKNVVFQVEGSLFRVPRFHFETSSEVFSDMFALPQADSKPEEGDGDAHPIKLEGIEAKDFECLLKVLYPRSPPMKEDLTTEHKWVSVLKLTTLWRFLGFRALAIDRLTSCSMNASERVVLGRQYSVYAWLRTGYIDLVKQSQTLSMEDVEKIGYLPSVRIFRLREELRKRHRKNNAVRLSTVTGKSHFHCAKCHNYGNQTNTLCCSCAGLANTSDYDLQLSISEIEKVVDGEFATELDDVQLEDKTFLIPTSP
ncbi:hypothetical protein VKT23_007920 [Stygiomarasmius scandens]|uniref:BTB domain-containing protein n=1 Tax=Marasmiellus scandens TaxID=2682957 RepID=A0ABR1JPY9_9AGAR